jgi:hypothetical protein
MVQCQQQIAKETTMTTQIAKTFLILLVFIGLGAMAVSAQVRLLQRQPNRTQTVQVPAAEQIAQDKRAKIKDYLNRGILVRDAFAGQSITIVKENEDYFVHRQIFGSGMPVIRSIKYKAELKSDWQIRFSGTTDDSHSENEEHFILCVQDKGLVLFLNGLQVMIVPPILDDNRRL